MPNSLIEIITEKWKTYRTSMIDELSFVSLVQQVAWDTIKILKIKDSCINEFMSSLKISDEIKNKIKKYV